MKHITAILAIMLSVGCKTLPDIKPPVITIPPITIPTIPTGSQPDKPATPVTVACGCKVGSPRLLPLQTRGNNIDEINKTLTGNMGMGGYPIDARMEFIRDDGRAWGLNEWINLGIDLVDNSHFKCKCFDDPKGTATRYHFIGYNSRELPEITPAKAGEVYKYEGGRLYVTFERLAK